MTPTKVRDSLSGRKGHRPRLEETGCPRAGAALDDRKVNASDDDPHRYDEPRSPDNLTLERLLLCHADERSARRARVAWAGVPAHRRGAGSAGRGANIGLHRIRSDGEQPARWKPRADHGARAPAAVRTSADRARRGRDGDDRRPE